MTPPNLGLLHRAMRQCHNTVEYVFFTARQPIRLSGSMRMLVTGRQFAELLVLQLHIRTLQLCKTAFNTKSNLL